MTARFPWAVSVIAATNTAYAANQEIRGPMCETIVPNLGGILGVDGETACRVRCPNHAVAPTKRTAVVPQAPVHGIDVGAIDYCESATMASALIFSDATVVETHQLPPFGARSLKTYSNFILK
jgi:hypothetical protein